MNKYKTIKPLGAGQFGEALLVENVQTKQNFVNKRIQLNNLHDEKRKYAFNETVVFSLFNHPYITQYVESINENDETLNIIMEYADGGDLSDYIENEVEKAPFSEKFIIKQFNQICDAIYHIHTRKIIHRDIKLENIFLKSTNNQSGDQEYQIKLGDFGVSKILNEEAVAYTFVGSQFYQAPEVNLASSGYSYKSDVFSLGCVIYELCSFKNLEKNYRRKLSVVKRIEQRKLQLLDSKYSTKLQTLINKMLEIDSNQRFDMIQVLDYMTTQYQQSNTSIMIKMNSIQMQPQFQQNQIPPSKLTVQVQPVQESSTQNLLSESIKQQLKNQQAISQSHKKTAMNPEYLDQLQQYQKQFLNYSQKTGGKEKYNQNDQIIQQQNQMIQQLLQKTQKQSFTSSPVKQNTQPIDNQQQQNQVLNNQVEQQPDYYHQNDNVEPVNLKQNLSQLDIFENRQIVKSIQETYVQQLGMKKYNQISETLQMHRNIDPNLLVSQNNNEQNDLMVIILKGLSASKSLSLI